MNTFFRLCIISCAFFGIAHASNRVTALQKEINLGKDPKTSKQLLIKAFAFIKSGDKENQDTRWYSVFPFEGKLAFYCNQSGQSDAFPINNVIQATEPTVVEFDLADKEFRANILEQGKKAKSLFTMKLVFSPELPSLKNSLSCSAKQIKML